MGVRGLSSYIHEYLSDVLEWHKLHRCSVIIDGNNLAHILYFECRGINAAFGGDYDKYASYVEKYFEKLRSCEVDAVVVMDGGQPLGDKKMRTVQERIHNQIQMCVRVEPSNQMKSKIFPCMGRQVFVTTLQKMGIMVLQTDFEADEEIAMLSKKLGLTVISNDSDFYVSDVPFILLESINHKNVCTEKKKKPTDDFNYMACYRFSLDRFCEITGMDRAHLPLLATLLGNDYLAFDVFTDFYAHLGCERKYTYTQTSSRHRTIRNTLSWLAKQKGRSIEAVIQNVLSLAHRKKLKGKMLNSVSHYTNMKTNLLSFINSDSWMKFTSEELSQPSSHFLRCKPETETLTKNSDIETDLVLKNGRKLPTWFIEAYRMNRIPHEVADILTQGYFISPPQVEEKSSDCSYLVVKPIVRAVYTMLWESALSYDYCQKYLMNCDDKGALMVHGKGGKKESHIFTSGENSEMEQQPERVNKCDLYSSSVTYDSDVVVEEDDENIDDPCFSNVVNNSDVLVEEDGEEDQQYLTNSELEAMPHLEGHQKIEGKEVSKDEAVGGVVNVKLDKISQEHDLTHKVMDEDNELMEDEENCNLVRDTKTKKYALKWYLRKGDRIWIKNLSCLPKKKATALPSLSEVSLLSISDKKKAFYLVLDSNPEFSDLDLPGDLELILDFIIYWFRNSKLPLKDSHALAVLVCIFMYYIIDGKIGRIRTKKAFEEVENVKAKLSDLQSAATYCNPNASVKDLLGLITHEECLVAGFHLFKFHHMDQKVNYKNYNKDVVHAFSEYQACVYFMQLLNSLLCSPFPMLSAECLWGGTFCYNIFHFLEKKSNPLIKIADFLGRGTCLERLFLKLFKRLGAVLNFKKCASMVLFVENLKVSKKKYRETKTNPGKEKDNDTKIKEKDKIENKLCSLRDSDGNRHKFFEENEDSVKEKKEIGKDLSKEQSGKSEENACKELLEKKKEAKNEQVCSLLGNRFAELVLDVDSDIDG